MLKHRLLIAKVGVKEPSLMRDCIKIRISQNNRHYEHLISEQEFSVAVHKPSLFQGIIEHALEHVLNENSA